MSSGVDIAAAAIAFVKVGKAALDLYQDAQLNTSQSHQELRFRLEVEAVTFDRWCSAVGINQMIAIAATKPSSWRNSPEFEVFKHRLQADLRFDSELVADLTVNALKDLNKKFENARGRLPTASPFFHVPRLFKRGRTEMVRFEGSTMVEKDANVLQGTRWLLWDKKVFLRLLQELASVNDSLSKLLPKEQQNQMKRRVNLQVLGNSSAGNLEIAQGVLADSGTSKEIGALAGLKSINLQENESDVDKTNLSTNGNYEVVAPTHGRVAQYQVDDFERDSMRIGPTRVQSSLENCQVLVEWKYYSSSHPLRLEQILRLASLVVLLGKDEVHKRFHIPHCRGLVHDENNHRIGIIYDVTVIESISKPACGDLQTLIRKTVAPPLGQRFAIAKQLSIAVHYLQSIHWLHKSLRSDNVVYFNHPNLVSQEPKPALKGIKELKSDTSKQGPSQEAPPGSNKNLNGLQNGVEAQPALSYPPPLPSFYVLGLDFSRPDHPAELSETLSISTAGHRSKTENIELYSHPESLQRDASGKHPRFRPQFDIYSLGLILLEIGLWRTVRALRQEAVNEQVDFGTAVQTDYCDKLRSKMGEYYWRATQRCLNNEFDFSDIPEGTEEGVMLQLAFERQVVSELEKCNA